MRTRHLRRALSVLLGGALFAFVLSSSAAPLGPDFALHTDLSRVGVTIGNRAVFQISVTAPQTLPAPVALAVTGVPSGSTVTVQPSQIRPGTRAVVSIVVGAHTHAGTYAVHVTGRSGGRTHSVTVTLAALAPDKYSRFSLMLTPPVRTVVGSGSAAYTVTLTRYSFTAPVGLSLTGLPANATATITPKSLSGSTAKITVAVPGTVHPGWYRLSAHATYHGLVATASAYLVVQTQHLANFPISGNADRLLSPGVTGLLNLTLTNPFAHPLRVQSLSVHVTGTNKPACTTANFQVAQFSGHFPLLVPAHSTRTLTQLGATGAQLPTVSMLNLPVNQDACQSTNISLAYTGSGSGT